MLLYAGVIFFLMLLQTIKYRVFFYIIGFTATATGALDVGVVVSQKMCCY